MILYLKNGFKLKINIFIFFLIVNSAFCFVYYVDKDMRNDSGDGLSWANAKKTIKSALEQAAAGDNIWVKSGLYYESVIMKSNVELYGGFSGFEKYLLERQENNRSIIDVSKSEDYTHGVFYWNNKNTRIDGFKIMNVRSKGNEVSGNGIACGYSDKTNTIANCEITSNSTGNYGSGITCRYGAYPVIENCIIYNNSGNGAGGIFINDNSGAIIKNCIISANNMWWSGGGIMVSENCKVDIINCIISGNFSAYAAVGNFYTSYVNMENCIISGNFTYPPRMGGLIFESSSGIIKNCIFSGNYAQWAGGILCKNSASVKIINCIFENNVNFAVYEFDELSNIKLINNLFYNNGKRDFYDHETGRKSTPEEINSVEGNKNNLSSDPKFIMDSNYGMTGKWTELPEYDSEKRQTILTDSNAEFKSDSLKWKIINANSGQYIQSLILGNTEKKIIVSGNVTEYTKINDPYKIIDYRPGYKSGTIDAVTSNTLSVSKK